MPPSDLVSAVRVLSLLCGDGPADDESESVAAFAVDHQREIDALTKEKLALAFELSVARKHLEESREACTRIGKERDDALACREGILSDAHLAARELNATIDLKTRAIEQLRGEKVKLGERIQVIVTERDNAYQEVERLKHAVAALEGQIVAKAKRPRRKVVSKGAVKKKAAKKSSKAKTR